MTSTIRDRIAPFDLETTGLDPSTARIVTAFVGRLDAAGNVVSGHEWLVRPDGFEIPETSTAIHGVTTEYAIEHGQPFAEVMAEVAAALTEDGIAATGHNLSYDFTVLAHELKRAGHTDPVGLLESLTAIDTFVLDKHLDTYRRGSGNRKLTAIAPLYGVTLTDEDAHGAKADAVASGRIALRMLDMSSLRDLSWEELHALQRVWHRSQAASFEEFKRRTDKTFTADRNWPLQASALALAVPADTYAF